MLQRILVCMAWGLARDMIREQMRARPNLTTTELLEVVERELRRSAAVSLRPMRAGVEIAVPPSCCQRRTAPGSTSPPTTPSRAAAAQPASSETRRGTRGCTRGAGLHPTSPCAQGQTGCHQAQITARSDPGRGSLSLHCWSEF